MALQQAFYKKHFKGFIETVPAYASLAVFYDVAAVKKNYPVTTSAFEFVKSFTEQLISKINDADETAKRLPINIPVYYNGEDLADVARQHQLSVEEVIRIHTGKPYLVYMIGFLPGFAYMGKVDERISTARHATPRAHVKPGSVGIAGFQTGGCP